MAPARSGEDAAEADVPGGIRLTVAGAAARLGVAASTLRTWERRYGLGPSARTAGRHRRYDADDVARLATMRRLTRQGVAPADAADLARGQEVDEAVPAAPAGEPAETEALDPLTLAAAAVDADEVRLRRLMLRAVPGRDVVRGWQTMIAPALELLAAPGRSDLPGRDPVWALGAAFLAHVRALPYPEPTGSAVLIHAEVERLLQAHALAAELSLLSHRARILRPYRDGTSVPLSPEAIGHAGLVVLLDPVDATALTTQLHEEVTVFVISLTGGVELDEELKRFPAARTLAGAVHEIDALLRQG